ncbi:GIY-YIG nuclease family protein [Flagellimonas sp.]|uniref:GIY-YIG nuclease family protein n=1 Tax=Flagellimonas sp. TaxID=2058762 RepID=UPI003BAB6315
MRTYFVYILKCSDNTYYTGITSDLMGRLESHQKGKYRDSYTYYRRPLELVYHCTFSDPNTAIMTEKQIKKWSKKKKEALIAGEFDKLPNLSKKNFSK